MYFITHVYSWSDKRDSTNRINAMDTAGYRPILLNPNRISDLIEGSDTTLMIPTSWFKFFDNRLDRRESWSYIKCRTAVSSIIDAGDTAFHSSFITLNFFIDNNPDNGTIATTLPVSCIAYADRYNPDNNYCWIVYYNAAFKRRERLANITIEQLEDIAETGTTSTTTTSTEKGQN